MAQRHCLREGFEPIAERLVKGSLVFVQGELTSREYDRTIKVTVSKKSIDHVIQQLVVELKADAIRVLDRSVNSQSYAAEPIHDDEVPF
jgi:single-stranded DNA-binding protein